MILHKVKFQDGVYERKYHIRDGDTVVDVGAQLGMFTIKAAKKADLVISIEPAKPNLLILKKTLSLKG